MRHIANKTMLLLVLLLVACSPALVSEPTLVLSPTPSIISTPATIQLPGNLDTVTFTEDDTEHTIRQLIPPDGIPPIYNPQFTSVEGTAYQDDELVMGVEINGDARAYSVGFLRRREMVNDVVGGIPILVTW